MAKDPNNSNCECPPSHDELLDDMQDPSGKYKHVHDAHSIELKGESLRKGRDKYKEIEILN